MTTVPVTARHLAHSVGGPTGACWGYTDRVDTSPGLKMLHLVRNGPRLGWRSASRPVTFRSYLASRQRRALERVSR